MSNGDLKIGESGLQFFGKMTASISHEIKNVLAIINEHAGILEDLVLMEDRGVPLDPEKVGGVAKRVAVQIQRADGIIKKMNKFAHSVDRSEASIDICEVVSLVASLSERFALNKGVTLELRPSDRPVTLNTHPFYLENLVWQCLDLAMDASGEDKTVGLVTEGRENGAVIRFTQLGALAETRPGEFPAGSAKALLAALNARMVVDAESREIVLTLPADSGPRS